MPRNSDYIPDYAYYHDDYRGRESAEAFESGLGKAVAVVDDLVGYNEVTPCTENAYKRAICAACDVIATYGYGPMGGFTIGAFTMQGDMTQHSATLAQMEARRELSTSGLLFGGIA